MIRRLRRRSRKAVEAEVAPEASREEDADPGLQDRPDEAAAPAAPEPKCGMVVRVWSKDIPVYQCPVCRIDTTNPTTAKTEYRRKCRFQTESGPLAG
jgi:hypothetical protein